MVHAISSAPFKLEKKSSVGTLFRTCVGTCLSWREKVIANRKEVPSCRVVRVQELGAANAQCNIFGDIETSGSGRFERFPLLKWLMLCIS